MTKIAMLADIHGNLSALQAVAQDLAQFDLDHVVVAGDVINWGPFNRQVVEFVIKRGWAVIRGNNELYLLDAFTLRAPSEWNDSSQYSLLPWLRDQLAGEWHQRIAAWPDALSLRFPDAPALRVVHGSPKSHWEPIFPGTPADQIEAMMNGVHETTVVAAHTHIAMDEVVGEWHVLNPGSVGVPLDGIFEASYLLMEGTDGGWRASMRRVPFDNGPIFEEFERQGFVEECGVPGRLVVAEFETALPHMHSFLNWRKRHHREEPLTMALLNEFGEVDPLDYAEPAYRLAYERNGRPKAHAAKLPGEQD